MIDGQADGAKVAAAAIQSAVYVLAMRTLLAEQGFPESAVAHDVVLVCPKDFSNQPTATFVDVRKQLTVLRRQLSRLTRIDALLSLLPPTLSLSTTRPAADVAADLRLIEARYMPECLNNCELCRFCRDEARGCTRVLGRTVAEDLGGVETVATALGLARGELPVSPEQVEAAALLRLAWSVRSGVPGERGMSALTSLARARAVETGRAVPIATRAARAHQRPAAGVRAAVAGGRGERAAGLPGGVVGFVADVAGGAAAAQPGPAVRVRGVARVAWCWTMWTAFTVSMELVGTRTCSRTRRSCSWRTRRVSRSRGCWAGRPGCGGRPGSTRCTRRCRCSGGG